MWSVGFKKIVTYSSLNLNMFLKDDIDYDYDVERIRLYVDQF